MRTYFLPPPSLDGVSSAEECVYIFVVCLQSPLSECVVIIEGHLLPWDCGDVNL